MRRLLVVLLGLAGLLTPTVALGQLSSTGNEQVVSYSGATAFVLTNTPVNPNLLTVTGTNTFIMNVNPPSNSARIYITNDTANACNNLTLTMASTGNSSLNSFNSFPNAWQSVNLQNGPTAGFSASAAITLPASGTVAVTSSPIIGSKIAIFLPLSGACATTNIDVQVVFGTFTSTSPNVQGIVPVGVAGTAVNPLLIGGLDASNNARMARVGAFGSVSGNFDGLIVGVGGITNTATYSSDTLASGQNGGPLLIANDAIQGISTAWAPLHQTSTTTCLANADCSALMTREGGVSIQDSKAALNASTTTNLWQGINDRGAVHACVASIIVTSFSGTSLDIFIQDSPDGVNYNDRLRFATVVATGKQFGGFSSYTAGNNPANFSTGSIAVSTKVDGPIMQYGRISYVVNASTSTFVVQVTCT